MLGLLGFFGWIFLCLGIIPTALVALKQVETEGGIAQAKLLAIICFAIAICLFGLRISF